MNTLSNKQKNDNIEKACLYFKKITNVNSEINKLVFGQENVIEQIVISLLCGGHALIIGLAWIS